jgi:hypothetical protein
VLAARSAAMPQLTNCFTELVPLMQRAQVDYMATPGNAYIGDLDLDRVQKTIDIDTPIFAGQGTPVKDGLKAADLVTNQFIDQSIGLPAK